jgi:hypothetical protein
MNQKVLNKKNYNKFIDQYKNNEDINDSIVISNILDI